MESLEALELAILEYKKDLEEDSNNQWVKNVLQGLKEVKQDLERLEELKKVIKFLSKYFEVDKVNKCYWFNMGEWCINLTKEQYDLLKEVLDNE